MENIIKDYLSGISVPKLSEKYKYSNPIIYKHLRENDIKIKTASEASSKYKINTDLFKTINEISAYWMQF